MDAAGSKSTCFHVKYETENLKQTKQTNKRKQKHSGFAWQQHGCD
uniref:Uncharacterized protein n=1 Tax=Anguilla anguilla TaxID=7936 RepID=A0A0E9UWF9_ANGAN